MKPDTYKQKASKKYQAKHRAKLTEIGTPSYRPKDQPFQNTLSNLATIKFESKKKELPSNAYRYKEEEDLEDQESSDQLFLKEIDNQTQKLISQIEQADQTNFDPSVYFNFSNSLVDDISNNENDTEIWSQINTDRLNEVLPNIALLDRLDFDSDTVEDLASFEANTIQIKPKIFDVSIPSSLPQTKDPLQMKAPKDLDELDKLLALDNSELNKAVEMPTIISPSKIKDIDDSELDNLLSVSPITKTPTNTRPPILKSPFQSNASSTSNSKANPIKFNNTIPSINKPIINKTGPSTSKKYQDDDDFLDELLNS